MSAIDRDAYDKWVELAIERHRESVSMYARILGDWDPPPLEIASYDEWLKAGKPGEDMIRGVLEDAGGRPDLYEPPNDVS